MERWIIKQSVVAGLFWPSQWEELWEHVKILFLTSSLPSHQHLGYRLQWCVHVHMRTRVSFAACRMCKKNVACACERVTGDMCMLFSVYIKIPCRTGRLSSDATSNLCSDSYSCTVSSLVYQYLLLGESVVREPWDFCKECWFVRWNAAKSFK